MFPTRLRQGAIAVALLAGIAAAAWMWRTWQAGAGDPSLTGDPREYVRASGPLITPQGIAIAAAFSDGPGRITVEEAVALRGSKLAEAERALGPPDLVLGQGKREPIAFWWNAVVSDQPADLQPPALHLRLDCTASTVRRAACLGAKLAEVAASKE